jgi:hypothetical protein
MWLGGYAMKRLCALMITTFLLMALGGVAAVSAVETNAGDISVPLVWDGSYVNILVYADDVYSDPPYVRQALDSLGYDYYYCYGEGADEVMSMAMESHSWSLIIISHCTLYNLSPTLFLTPAAWNQNYASTDIIVATYDIDGSHSYPAREWDELLDTLGVQTVSDLDSARTIYGWDAELWKGVPPLTNPNGHYIDNGDKLEKLAGVTAAGGFTASPQSDEIAIIKGTSSTGKRFIINSFTFDNYDGDNDGDGMPDAVELWRNEIQWAKNGKVSTPVDEFPAKEVPLLMVCGFLAIVLVLTRKDGPK